MRYTQRHHLKIKKVYKRQDNVLYFPSKYYFNVHYSFLNKITINNYTYYINQVKYKLLRNEFKGELAIFRGDIYVE